MNLRWNHILLACLLTVLEIYGTEATLWIPYSTGPHSQSSTAADTKYRDSKDLEYVAMEVSFHGQAFAMLKPGDATAPFSYTFAPEQQMTASDKILFQVQQDNGRTYDVLYKPEEVVVTKQSDQSLTIKSARQTDNVDGEDEIRLYMNDVRQVINGIKCESPVPLSTLGRNRVLKLPKAIKFSVNFRVGTYPAGPTPSGNVLSRLWKSSRRWNFTPTGHMLTANFVCNSSIPVEFYRSHNMLVDGAEMTVLAYVVPKRNGGYRLVKGNTNTISKDIFCTLYLKSAHYEIQFPGLRKRHINVAHVADDIGDFGGEVRSCGGFRVYMNGLQWHAHEEEEEEQN